MTRSSEQSLGLRIDSASDTPPFAQIRGQVNEAAASGRLPAGTRLPTVRALAEALGVAPGTVAKAYRELEEGGTIETRGRAGSFIAARGDGPSAAVVAEAARFAALCRRDGVEPEQAVALLRAALAASRPS